MLSSDLGKFLIRRAALFLLALLAAALLFAESRWPLFFGLLLGAALGLLHFVLHARFFRAAARGSRPTFAVFAVNQLLTFFLLMGAYFYNSRFFAAVVAGALLLPFALLLNVLTEGLGLTDNRFFL